MKHCPWTSPDECATAGERAVAGTAMRPPLCATHETGDRQVVITIRSRDYDTRPRRIAVEREDDTAWYGWPIDNGMCPTLVWPKYAWEEVPATCLVLRLRKKEGLTPS